MHEIDGLPVPEFNFSAVKERADLPQRRRARRTALTLASLAVLAPALVAAAATYFHPHIYRSGNALHVYAHKVTENVRPTRATLAGIASEAPYSVILPRELPPFATLKSTIVADSELIDLLYSCPGKRLVHIVIAPTALRSLLRPEADPHRHVTVIPKVVGPWHTFIAGDEIVRLQTNCMSAFEITKVRSAMIAAGRALK